MGREETRETKVIWSVLKKPLESKTRDIIYPTRLSAIFWWLRVQLENNIR